MCNQIHFASILNCYQRTDMAKVCILFIWLPWLTLLGGRKMFFRETVYSWILWNMARYYYRNILQTSAASVYKSIYINDKGMSIFPICLFLFHKHAISPVYLNRGWLFLIKDMFKHIDRNHKFAFYLSCENSHGTLHKHWDA